MARPEGLDRALAAMRRLRRPELRGDRLHDAIVRAWKEVGREIPQDSGALFLSITRKSDRFHVVSISPDGHEVAVGSSLRQARYQGHRLPTIDGRIVARAAFDDYVSQVGASYA